MEIISI